MYNLADIMNGFNPRTVKKRERNERIVTIGTFLLLVLILSIAAFNGLLD